MVAAVLGASIGSAQSPEPSDSTAGAATPSLAELEREGYRVGKVSLSLGDVFDESKPGERFVLFRLANRLHRTTRPEVVRRLLLFQPGDALSAARVAESERMLRGERYFYDARIRPVRVDGDAVDLEVDTRDVWSLSASVGFHRSGGVNTTRFALEDTNLLGTGKELKALYESNVDRSFGLLRYADRSLLGSRAQLELEAADASDGNRTRVSLSRPFFSLDTRWSLGVEASNEERIDARYDLGHVTSRFGVEERSLDLVGGWSAGQRDGRTQRLTAGLTWYDVAFRPVEEAVAGGDGLLPDDRTLLYPWIGWEWIEDGFAVTRDLDKIARSEDINLGARASARLGYASGGLGSSESAIVVRAAYGDGVNIGARQLLLVNAHLDGRYSGGEVRGLLGTVHLRDTIRDAEHGRLVLGLRYDFSRRLDAEDQLLVGGDSGLRGYPLRYQPGDQILTATLEQRFYSDRELFHLLRLGAAAFVDVARVWADENAAARRPYELLRDIGVGLRISSSRSARAAMIHLDVAYPLDGGRDLSRLQWLVTTSETF